MHAVVVHQVNAIMRSVCVLTLSRLNCNLGYSGSGHYCRDINECEINNGGCSVAPRVPCINTRVSFTLK